MKHLSLKLSGYGFYQNEFIAGILKLKQLSKLKIIHNDNNINDSFQKQLAKVALANSMVYLLLASASSPRVFGYKKNWSTQITAKGMTQCNRNYTKTLIQVRLIHRRRLIGKACHHYREELLSTLS